MRAGAIGFAKKYPWPHGQPQRARSQPGFPEHTLYPLHQIGLLELPRREVHAHAHAREFRAAALAPLHQLPRRFRQAPVAHRQNQPRLFGQRDEIPGRQQAPPRVPPAHQRLEAHNPIRAQIHFRLVVHRQLALADRLFQIRLELHPCQRPLAHAPRIAHHSRWFFPARMGQRALRIAHQVVRMLVLRIGAGNADRQLRRQLAPPPHKRLAEGRARRFREAHRCCFAVCRIETHDKLRPVQPRRQRTAWQQGLQALRRFQHQAIGAARSQHLVHAIEAVQRQRKHREVPVAHLARPLQPRLQMVEEIQPVRQPGQRIGRARLGVVRQRSGHVRYPP
jgi:hypothetical protein